MALRPTELQIILTATRDIERVQQLAQQQPRLQQEYLISQFQHQIEERKHQAPKVAQPDQAAIKKVGAEGEEEQARARKRKRGPADDDRDDKDKPKEQHIIDLLI
jgi:hypothetical protein